MEGQKDVDFRKAIKLGAGNTMRSSDLRKLVVEAKILGDMSATGLQVQKVLGTKVQIFSVPESGEPLFFQTNKKGPLYPTLYAVWKGLILHLPVVETSETGSCCLYLFFFFHFFLALESIQRGSDLFAPGIQSVSSDNVQKNDVVLVCVDGKIVGVGKAVSALSGLESGSAGWKKELCLIVIDGTLVCVLHCFGDSVWQLGSKCDPCPLPSREAEVIEPEKVEEVAVTLSVAETDEMMKEAFVLALRGLKKAEFPLLFSTFAAKMTLSSPKPFNVKQVTSLCCYSSSRSKIVLVLVQEDWCVFAFHGQRRKGDQSERKVAGSAGNCGG
jgi:predicted ribosome-associated RNA-binding protein Tma20